MTEEQFNKITAQLDALVKATMCVAVCTAIAMSKESANNKHEVASEALDSIDDLRKNYIRKMNS